MSSYPRYDQNVSRTCVSCPQLKDLLTLTFKNLRQIPLVQAEKKMQPQVLLFCFCFQMVREAVFVGDWMDPAEASASISSSPISDQMEMGHEEPNQSYNISAALFPIAGQSRVVY